MEVDEEISEVTPSEDEIMEKMTRDQEDKLMGLVRSIVNEEVNWNFEGFGFDNLYRWIDH